MGEPTKQGTAVTSVLGHLEYPKLEWVKGLKQQELNKQDKSSEAAGNEACFLK